MPPQLAATGLAIHALAAGVARAVLTPAGALYVRFRAAAFFAKAALCVSALQLPGKPAS
ncbi:hypothetical protein [Bosea psychrotolerans]|uniref:hypothetical protein n=1 Tax=Bosea psychrotolerans TaxID=1871628 RepID=UPI0015E1A9D4|nr:hypothetical protein [Bosea psychrotolerans]